MFCTYEITCIGNNKKYYGSSKSFRNRRTRHLFYLRHNQHINQHLQNAFNKYGEESFKFKVLKEFGTREEMLDAEQKLIDATYGESFNKSKSSKSPQLFGSRNGFFGKKHTQETKDKISAVHKGKRNWRAKVVITSKGIYTSIDMACKYHDIQKSTYYRRLKRGTSDWFIV